MTRFSIPLLGKVVLALAIVALMPFGIFAYLTQQAGDAMVLQAQATHLAAVRSAASRVSSYVELLASISRSAIRAPVIYQAPRSAAAGEVLGNLLQTRSDLFAVATYLDDGQGPEMVLTAKLQADGRDIGGLLRPLVDADLLIEQDASGLWIRLRTLLPEHPGFSLLLLANFERVDDILDPPELQDDAKLVLTSGAGEVIAGAGELAEFPALLVESALSGKVGYSAEEFAMADGQRLVGAFAAVEGTPFAVLSRQPEETVQRAAAQMRRQTLRLFLVVLAVSALLAVGTYLTIVRPIRELARAQRQLAGLDSGGEGLGGAEIEQLQSSFALLEQNLYDREALSKVFLGRYQVVEVLAVGAMGTVFRGFDPRLQRTVALKTFKVGAELDEQGRRELAGRLVQEAVTLARLHHPSIVTVFDVEEAGEVAFIAMELVEGISLEAYLIQEGRLAAEQVIALAIPMMQAIAAAHRQDIVHHDVKPANILLGEDGSVKVTDFGISEMLSNPRERPGVVCGTPGYLPPETLEGKGYTPRSDLFAAGVVLYQCLTGQRPFVGSKPRDIMVQTLLGKLTPLHRLLPSLRTDLEVLVMSLLAANPEQRPVDAQAVVNSLQAMAEDDLRWSPKPFQARNRNATYKAAVEPHATVHTSMLHGLS